MLVCIAAHDAEYKQTLSLLLQSAQRLHQF